MDSKIQKVINKINALRSISEHTNFKAEKETTIELAAKLIAEYQLSEAEVEAGKQSNERVIDPIDIDNFHIIYETGRSTPWKTALVWSLSELNGLYSYVAPIRDSVSHRRGSRYRVIGRKSDIDIAIYMFNYLTTTISSLVDDYVPKTNKRGVSPERESWCLGCVRGFIDKMKKERDKVLMSASSGAIVLISNKTKEAKETFLAKTKMKMGTVAPSKAKRSGDAYSSGYQKGQTLTVNPSVGAAAPIKLLK